MRVLVIIFGGIDFKFLSKFRISALKQNEFGPVHVNGLWGNRDVATQITSQLITGLTWKDTGIRGRRRYTNPRIEALEKSFFRGLPFEGKWRPLREGFYQCFSGLRFEKRNYLKEDLKCKSLFDKARNSKAIYVPSYNPEPAWALRRNILDPRKFPEFGEAGALDLLEKNFSWRRKKLLQELNNREYQLLMCQFQYIDSLQHLYIAYCEYPQMEEIQKGYARIDAFAKEILQQAEQYDLVLFLSDNGAAGHPSEHLGQTHHNRPFYSLNIPMGLKEPNMRDLHDCILEWITQRPHSGMVAK